MKQDCARTLGPFLALLLVVFSSGPTNSAIIPRNEVQINLRGVPLRTETDARKENITMELFEEAVDDYVDLSNAFYAPAANEALREKRANNVFRTIANRTRSGVASLRKLFSGRRRNMESSEGNMTGRRFRKFFGNLLNRILVFLTNLWDRITGIFRGRTKTMPSEDGEEGGEVEKPESGGAKLVKRIRTGAAALAKRFRGAGGGSSGGAGAGGILASLTSILGPQSTVEPYEVDYDDSDAKDNPESEGSTDTPSPSFSSSTTTSSSSTTTSNVDKSENYESSGGYGGYNKESIDNSVAATINAGQFVPFPMDSDPNYHLNGVPVSNYYYGSPSPWILRSPVLASPYSSYT